MSFWTILSSSSPSWRSRSRRGPRRPGRFAAQQLSISGVSSPSPSALRSLPQGVERASDLPRRTRPRTDGSTRPPAKPDWRRKSASYRAGPGGSPCRPRGRGKRLYVVYFIGSSLRISAAASFPAMDKPPARFRLGALSHAISALLLVRAFRSSDLDASGRPSAGWCSRHKSRRPSPAQASALVGVLLFTVLRGVIVTG